MRFAQDLSVCFAAERGGIEAEGGSTHSYWVKFEVVELLFDFTHCRDGTHAPLGLPLPLRMNGRLYTLSCVLNDWLLAYKLFICFFVHIEAELRGQWIRTRSRTYHRRRIKNFTFRSPKWILRMTWITFSKATLTVVERPLIIISWPRSNLERNPRHFCGFWVVLLCVFYLCFLGSL